MDLSGHRILAYLEEDNTQRTLFRVRPLLFSQGLLSGADIAAYRDHGYLRIAPDRQEQHNFKERMKSLGSLCLMDFRSPAQSQGKVRQNRNYAPSRGESNRYIVYSDAIKALPDDLVYEVVGKEDSRQRALTPRYYVRSGGFITGPYASQDEEGQDAPQSLPPDCDRLFLVPMPDSQHRLFYWPEESPEAGESDISAEKAPEKEKTAAETPGASLRSLADLFFRRKQPLLIPQNDLKQAAQAAEEALSQAGFDCGLDQAAHLLLLALLFPRVQLACPVVADALTLGETLARLLGQQASLQAEDAALTLGSGQLFLSQNHGVDAPRARAYALSPWPIISLEAKDTWPQEAKDILPLNRDQLTQQLLESPGELSAATESRLRAWQRRLADLDAPLPIAIKQAMLRYLRHANAFFEEEAAPLDLAAAAFILPYARSRGVPVDALRAMLVEQTQALKLL